MRNPEPSPPTAPVGPHPSPHYRKHHDYHFCFAVVPDFRLGFSMGWSWSTGGPGSPGGSRFADGKFKVVVMTYFPEYKKPTLLQHFPVTYSAHTMAQPKPEGPTDEELLRLAREWNSGFESIELHFAADYARAVLARWGNPTPQPVAKGPTIPNAKLHRQELTPLEITLLIEALDFAIGDIKARPNSSNHVAVRAKLKRSISHPRGHQ